MAISYGYFNRFQQLTSCRVAAVSNLTVTYLNGINNNGIGATLTNAGSQAALTIDDVALNLNDRVLITAQTTELQNGIYIVTNVGSSSSNWVLTRSSDFQSVEQMATGMFVPIEAGSLGAGAFYTLVEPLPTAIGVSDIVFQGQVAVGDITFVGSPIIGNLPSIADLNGNIEDSGIVANTVLYTSFATPDTNSNIFVIPASSIPASSLNSGAVSIFTPTGSKTYRVLAARTGGAGNADFSGGGGDRNLVVQMGSTAYASIPAATAQAISTVPLILGSGTEFIYVNGGNLSQGITAAAPLQLAYSGGTTNYSAGDIGIEFLIQRVS